MLRAIVAVAVVLLGAMTADAGVGVRGYFRSDGTYVAPHFRSSPNYTRFDNWSTWPNYNPYTGRPGTRSAWDYPSYPSYRSTYPYRYDR